MNDYIKNFAVLKTRCLNPQNTLLSLHILTIALLSCHFLNQFENFTNANVNIQYGQKLGECP